MALAFEVCQARSEQSNVRQKSAKDSLEIGWDTEFLVKVSDPENPDLTPADVTAIDVCYLTSLPQVNRSIYYKNGKIIPFLVCREKQVVRDSANAFMFNVRCRYDTGTANNNYESDNYPIDPPASIGQLAPRVEVAVGTNEFPLYQDANQKRAVLPTGNPYEEPLLLRRGTQIYRITQYEPFLSYDDMADRRWKTNSDTYRGLPANNWLITEIEATEVEVQLSGGPALAALVTYTIERAANLTTGNEPFNNGWNELRALIDTHYLQGAGGPKEPFTTADTSAGGTGETYDRGLILSDGTKKPDQSAPPDYENYQTYLQIPFGDFMQA